MLDSPFRERVYASSKYVVKTNAAVLPLYLSLVRPILEDAIQAISPYLQEDIDVTERLQKLATRLVK